MAVTMQILVLIGLFAFLQLFSVVKQSNYIWESRLAWGSDSGGVYYTDCVLH
jgi:hypothetical protein